jgi:hypothetical protein
MVPDTNLSTYESKKVKYEIRYPGDNGGEVTPKMRCVIWDVRGEILWLKSAELISSILSLLTSHFSLHKWWA